MTAPSPRAGGFLGWLARIARDGRAQDQVRSPVARYDTGSHPARRARSDWQALPGQGIEPGGPLHCAFRVSAGPSTGLEGPSTTGNSLVHDALRFSQQRRLEAAHIAHTLRRRNDVAQAPHAVQAFLLRSWALVMAHARLTQAPGAATEAQLQQVTTDLLWSVHRPETLRHPARLFHMIPGLLQRLRDGLALLGEDPRDSAAFFRALEGLHRPVLRLCALRRHEDQLDTAAMAGAEAADGLDAGLSIDTLCAGDAVRLYAGRRWVPVRLAWVGHGGHLFMFTSESGRAYSMTRRVLQRLLRERLLRPLAPPAGTAPAA